MPTIINPAGWGERQLREKRGERKKARQDDADQVLENRPNINQTFDSNSRTGAVGIPPFKSQSR